MADLQSCYFCGAPDDLGEYAVVPPRLGGGDRSVVLCPDCKTKLLRVMEPLIERAEGSDGDETGSEPEPESTGDGSAEAPDGATPGADGITMNPGGTPSSSGEADGTDDAAGATATHGAADTPAGYRRAMRMLSNRPFPIDRTEAESMLAAAYDLEREEVDAVIDHAVDEGRLVVEDGQLREP